jgi:hypothetical protein
LSRESLDGLEEHPEEKFGIESLAYCFSIRLPLIFLLDEEEEIYGSSSGLRKDVSLKYFTFVRGRAWVVASLEDMVPGNDSGGSRSTLSPRNDWFISVFISFISVFISFMRAFS